MMNPLNRVVCIGLEKVHGLYQMSFEIFTLNWISLSDWLTDCSEIKIHYEWKLSVLEWPWTIQWDTLRFQTFGWDLQSKTKQINFISKSHKSTGWFQPNHWTVAAMKPQCNISGWRYAGKGKRVGWFCWTFSKFVIFLVFLTWNPVKVNGLRSFKWKCLLVYSFKQAQHLSVFCRLNCFDRGQISCKIEPFSPWPCSACYWRCSFTGNAFFTLNEFWLGLTSLYGKSDKIHYFFPHSCRMEMASDVKMAVDMFYRGVSVN